MKKRLVCGAMILAALAVPVAARAQKSYAIGFGGGAAIPVGKLGNTQKMGYNALVTLAIGVSDLPLGVRFDGIYNNLLHPSAAATGGTQTSDLRVKAAVGNLVYAFPGTTAKLYLLAGGGLYNSKADVAGARSENSFGVNGGIGATFGFGPFAAFLESRYVSVSRKEEEGGVYQYVPITLGVLF